jgi:ATP synthase protein I
MKKTGNDYLKYTGIAFQMLAIIGAGVALGSWADKKWNPDKKTFTVFFSLISVLLAMGLIIKDFIKKK